MPLRGSPGVPSPHRRWEVMRAYLQEHGAVTSLQAGRLMAGEARDRIAAAVLLTQGRTWCVELRRAGLLQPGAEPDTWAAQDRGSGPTAPR